MKKSRNSWKKWNALVLAVVMTATMAVPVHTDAQEGTVTEDSVEEQKTSVLEKETKQVQEEQMQAEQQTEQLQKEEVQENQKQEELQVEVKKETEKETEGTEVPESKATEEKAVSQEKKQEKKVEGRAADTTQPVIEKVEFLQAGQTLKEGDKAQLYVYAYDTESGIERVEANLTIDYPEYDGNDSDFVSFTYDEERKCYVGEYVLKNVGDTTTARFTNIRVVDKSSNIVYYQKECDTFQIKAEDKTVKAKLTLAQNGATFNQNNVWDTFSDSEIETTPALEGTVTARFENEKGNTIEFDFYRREDSNKFHFSGLKSNLDWFESGTYTLKEIYQARFGKDLKLDIDNPKQYTCTYVKEEEVENEKPIITGIELTKEDGTSANGTFVEAGEKVNVKIKAKSNQKLDDYGAMYFYAAANNIEDDYEYVHLVYNKTENAYYGTFEITDDTYPCEWYVHDVYIYNEGSKQADDDKILQDYPYYVNVKKDGTFVNPTCNVNVRFITLDKNGNEVYSDSIQKTVERRTSYKEAGIVFPELKSEYEGLTQIGWKRYDGREATENSVILGNESQQIYAAYDKLLVHGNYSYLNQDGEEGYIDYKNILLPLGSTYGDAEKELRKEETPKDLYKGLTFQSWNLENEDKDTVISSNLSIYLSMKAIYDKSVLLTTYCYPLENANCMYEQKPILMEKGSTYGNALKEACNYQPKEMYTAYPFEKWEYNLLSSNITEDTELSDGINYVYLESKFKGKNYIPVEKNYYNKDGYRSKYMQNYQSEGIFVEEGTTIEQVKELLNKQTNPEMYPELRFDKWDIYVAYSETNDKPIENFTDVSMSAKYENCIIRYLINPNEKSEEMDYRDEDGCDVFCQVAEKGDTVTVKKSFDGYQSVEWLWELEDSFVVDGDRTFYGYGVKVGEPEKPVEPDQPTEPEKPVEPDQPTEPEKPVEPDQPTEPEKPVEPNKPVNPSLPDETPDGTKLPDSQIHNVVDMIGNVAEGESISVDMGTATVVPQEILEAAKGKDVDIQLNMGGYSWTINGKDIQANNLKDINLEVKLNANAIPSNTVKQLAGDNPVQQLSLTHNGDFGFKASLTVNVGSEHAGKYGNLFYYDSVGKMVFMNAGKINPDGTVSLAFSHASDYVIVMNAKKMSSENNINNTNNTNNTNKPVVKPTTPTKPTTPKAPTTEDTFPVMPTMAMLFLAVGVMVSYSIKVRSKKTK